MRDKLIQQSKEHPALPYKPYPEPPVLGKLFKKKGAFDGKLFHTSKKATYTFVDQREVIALHFDRERRAIFYKGHSISNLKLTEQQIQHLEMFRHELEKNPKTHALAPAYVAAMNEYLKENGLKSARDGP